VIRIQPGLEVQSIDPRHADIGDQTPSFVLPARFQEILGAGERNGLDWAPVSFVAFVRNRAARVDQPSIVSETDYSIAFPSLPA
jgi:hypothetical protein